MPTEATIDIVSKAIDHRFGQAGPSLVMQEHRDGQPRDVLLGSDCFVTVPTKLEAGHHQYATFVYFDNPQVVFYDQHKWFWLILLYALSYHGIFSRFN